MLRFRLSQAFPDSIVYANFDDEPEPRKSILAGFLDDMYDQEVLYLSEIAKAEAGETILDLYNNWVHAYLYPDGRAILEDMCWSDEDEAELGPRARTEITLAEAKQLILDWLAAKKAWKAQRAAAKADAATKPPPGSSTGGAVPATPDKT